MTTSRQAKEEAPAKEAKSTKVVRYRGIATRRVITAEEWARVGAAGTSNMEWSFRNNLRIPVSDFSEEALAYLRKDDGFVIEE